RRHTRSTRDWSSDVCSSDLIWGTGHDGKRVTVQREIANTEIQITAFTVDQHDQLLITDYAGSIYRLVRAPKQSSITEFPKRLSRSEERRVGKEYGCRGSSGR